MLLWKKKGGGEKGKRDSLLMFPSNSLARVQSYDGVGARIQIG